MKSVYSSLTIILIPLISYTMQTKNNESFTVHLKYQTNHELIETAHMHVKKKKQHIKHQCRGVKLDPNGVEMHEQYSKEKHTSYSRV